MTGLQIGLAEPTALNFAGGPGNSLSVAHNGQIQSNFITASVNPGYYSDIFSSGGTVSSPTDSGNYDSMLSMDYWYFNTGVYNPAAGEQVNMNGTSGDRHWYVSGNNATVFSFLYLHGLERQMEWDGAGSFKLDALSTSSLVYTDASKVLTSTPPSTTFSSLALTTNGQQIYCSDCKVTSSVDNTCAGSGTGAQVFRINGANKCVQ